MAQAAGRQIGRSLAHPADKIEYARLLKGRGGSLSQIAAKTGIPRTSVHRYLAPAAASARKASDARMISARRWVAHGVIGRSGAFLAERCCGPR